MNFMKVYVSICVGGLFFFFFCFEGGMWNLIVLVLNHRPSFFYYRGDLCPFMIHSWPRDYKTFFVLNSVEHEILKCL